LEPLLGDKLLWARDINFDFFVATQIILILLHMLLYLLESEEIFLKIFLKQA